MNQPPDPFEFLKNLWGPMGLPLAGVTAPTLGQDEIERRIAELKLVENWLNMNLNVLRMTIQGLEMQKSGLAAMREAGVMVPRSGNSMLEFVNRGEAMPKAIRIQQQGGPEVLKWEDVQVGDPGPGEARVRHKACGLNFLDVYQRSGLYKLPMPSGMGNEGAGVVEAVGAGVTQVKAGDRVAYAGGAPGAYSEVRTMPADRLVVLPEGISFETAAAMMLKGMTAQYLLRRTHKVQSGETILFHAAAGGVGLIACQWLKALGATVIGTAGSEEKCALAKAHGADHCINYRKENFVERVKALTGGKGVPVVYDSVGKDTFTGSLDCLQPRGLMVSFGNSSGAVPAFELGVLSQKGSLYVTRPTLVTHTSKREDLVATAKDLFDVVLSGKVKIEVNHRYPLKDAAQAQRDLEARKTTGSTILIP